MNYTDNWNQIEKLVKSMQSPAEKNELFLFGAGLLGAMAVPNLKNEATLTAICDNNIEKQGTVIEDLPCISPNELMQYQNPFVLISTNKYYEAVHQQLEQMKVPNCSLDGYVVYRHFQEVKEVFDLLDDESKNVYSGILLARMTGDMDMIEQYYSPNQYFCFPKFSCLANRDGVFVDCGAFVGDTVEDIVQHSLATFKKIYAFEPMERTFKALKKRGAFLTDIWALSEGQIIYEQKGVGAKHEFLSFRENTIDLAGASLASNRNTEADIVEVIALDEYFAQRESKNIALIKADIEGSEWDMLHGASKTIQQCKPLMAICLYHNIFDFYRIPLYLKELVPEYKFHIRHHSNTNDETVLYCYI